MAIFTQGDNSCYFVHIPRTAGRHVFSLFENSDDILCELFKAESEGTYVHVRQDGNCVYYGQGEEDVNVMHLYYPLYCDICPDDIPHITVVRNPYDKIFSSLKNMSYVFHHEYDSILKDEFECFKFLFFQILNESHHNSWFLPQHKFISPNTHVWKYEWGFGRNFQSWVKEKTGIKLNMSKIKYRKLPGEGDHKDFSLSNQSQRNIKKFYRKDYDKFNYWRW